MNDTTLYGVGVIDPLEPTPEMFEGAYEFPDEPVVKPMNGLVKLAVWAILLAFSLAVWAGIISLVMRLF